MTATEVEAQEKKDEKPLKKPYTERVELRHWVANSNRFNLPIPGVSAYRLTDKDGKTRFGLSAFDATGSANPKSEITDKDGKVYVVVRDTGRDGGAIVVVVEPKK
ncbi:MAG: hypothetical protein C0467_31870 [Planctomycetaceae bacterium]|nr:hypothetical protein [Planctomycetaceae bacterium]